MAFVYQSQRWQDKQGTDFPGPGSYDFDSPRQSPTNRKKNIYNHQKGRAFPKKALINQESNFPLPMSKSIINESAKSQPVIKNKQKITYRANLPQSTVQNNKSIQILQVQKIHAQYSPRKKKDQEKSSFIQLSLMKTSPSIQNCTNKQFFIGPSTATSGQQPKRQKKFKTKFQKPFSKNNCYKQQRSEFENENELLKTVINQLSQKHKKKPLSAVHPFRKRQIFFQTKEKDDNQTQQPTGLSLDQDFGSQFQKDAVPGPGSYEIQKAPMSTKKGMMFTQNKDRFQDLYKKQQQDDFAAIYYDIKKVKFVKPIYKRKSNKNIGFGSSVAGGRNQIKNINQKYRFYEDVNSIENKVLCRKLKDSIQPGCFINRKPRFSQRKQQSTNFRMELQKQYAEVKKNNNAIYGSKKNVPFNSTAASSSFNNMKKQYVGVDYAGQSCNTIQEKLDKQQQRIQYLSQDTGTAFLCTSKRFNYIEKQNIPKKKSQIQIKHQLIQTVSGFRYRSNKAVQKNKITNSHTFSKNPFTQKRNEISPSPDTYDSPDKWVKQSFNSKFIYKNLR